MCVVSKRAREQPLCAKIGRDGLDVQINLLKWMKGSACCVSPEQKVWRDFQFGDSYFDAVGKSAGLS